MCTLSWLVSDKTLTVLFNRDESVARAMAIPPIPSITSISPELDESSQPFLAPRDPARGGTWIAVRGDGVVLALLNHYGHPVAENAWRSRGAIILGLASARDLDDEWKKIMEIIEDFPPFHLITLRRGEITSDTWTGRDRESEYLNPSCGMFTTSSSPDPLVKSVRERTFSDLVEDNPHLTAEALQLFHDGWGNVDAASSVMMDRGDRRTVSQSSIKITTDVAHFAYRQCYGQSSLPDSWVHSSLAIHGR